MSSRDGFRFGEALPSAQEGERLLGVSTRLVLEAQVLDDLAKATGPVLEWTAETLA